MNSGANIKQFRLVKFINENCSDDHVISKISIVLRRDKIEAPYYMDTKIRLSSCIDMAENGIIHAMNILNHNRNITKSNRQSPMRLMRVMNQILLKSLKRKKG